jgi:hypothetical protein
MKSAADDLRDPCTANYCYCFFDPAHAPCSPQEVAEMQDYVKKANQALTSKQPAR